MNEPIDVENEKQSHQKPPLSVGRIACEILAGTATGLAVALPVGYVIYTADVFQAPGDFGALKPLLFLLLLVPTVYGPGSAVGVYLVGNRRSETGSFLLTLVGGFVGVATAFGVVFVMMPLFSIVLRMFHVPLPLIVVRGGTIVGLALALLMPPIFATYGFNSRRRHK